MASVAESLELSGPLEDSLERFVSQYLEYLQKEKRFLKLQLTLLMMPELNNVVLEQQQRRARLLLDMMSNWLKESDCTHPRKKARLLLALFDGVALHYLCVYDRYPLSSMKSHLIRAAKDVCANKTEINSQERI
jgi:hypothetical protein